MINNFKFDEFYPFLGNPNFKKIFFSVRYLSLIDNFLKDNDIKYTIHDPEEAIWYNLKFPEYANEKFISINIDTLLRHRLLYYEAEQIIITENITLDNLYDTLCESYDANKWYHKIKEFTFESVLIDLSQNQINYILEKESDDFGLVDKINNEILPLTTNNNKIFVRLYSLSPKDSIYFPSMIISNADDVIQLLRSSERTIDYLKNYSNQGIILRQYEKSLKSKNEFRLFIFDKKLRAISQYQYYIKIEKYSDSDLRQIIYDSICDYFNKVANLIDYSDYVLDIVFLNNFSTIKIIEINTFGPGLLSEGGLFDWKNDYDIMHNSVVPCIRFYF